MYELAEMTEVTEMHDVDAEEVFSDTIAEEAWEWVNDIEDVSL